MASRWLAEERGHATRIRAGTFHSLQTVAGIFPASFLKSPWGGRLWAPVPGSAAPGTPLHRGRALLGFSVFGDQAGPGIPPVSMRPAPHMMCAHGLWGTGCWLGSRRREGANSLGHQMSCPDGPCLTCTPLLAPNGGSSVAQASRTSGPSWRLCPAGQCPLMSSPCQRLSLSKAHQTPVAHVRNP